MTGIALLGAGIFAREQHLPAIEACESLSLKAIYSRSQSSAEALRSAATSSPDIYFDFRSAASATPDNYFESTASDTSLDALLARPDIHAVVIALPIVSQPEYIKKALKAGKHVLSEKPIAKDVGTAQELLAWYEGLGAGKPIWGVAENWRFWETIEFAKGKIGELGGEVVTFGFEMFKFVDPEDKYFNTAWRKTPEYQGGFLLDGGVHFVAGLRALLSSANDPIASLTARTALLQPRLLPVDTLHGLLTTKAGRSGTFSVSFASQHKGGMSLEVVTTNGSVRVSPVDVVVTKGAKEVRTEFERDSGVKGEVRAFAEAVGRGSGDERLSPREALRDLVVLQGLLESGEKGGAVKTVEG